MALNISNISTPSFSQVPTLVDQHWDQPQAPISTTHIENVFESTLSLKAVDGLTVDVCSLMGFPGELIISVSDQDGNQVAGIVLSPAVLQNYLDTLAAGKEKAC